MDFLGNQINQIGMDFLGNQMGFCKEKTQGAKKKKKKSNFFCFPWGFCMNFLGNQMRTNFPRNRMGDGFSWELNEVRKQRSCLVKKNTQKGVGVELGF